MKTPNNYTSMQPKGGSKVTIPSWFSDYTKANSPTHPHNQPVKPKNSSKGKK